MHTDHSSDLTSAFSRRDFVKTSALAAGTIAAAGVAMPALGRFGYHSGSGKLKVGVIGCGGRGTGAMADALSASPDIHIHALGDVFPDRIEGARSQIQGLPEDQIARCQISAENVYTGFDAYKKVCATDVDIVILATPPHFRSIHLAEAINRGKHVFMEKPVAVDPRGVRSVIASAEAAKAKNLSIVAGTQRRHEPCYLEAMKRIHGGEIGRIVSARCYWNQGGLWMHDRQEKWSDMEWQLRNWLYFHWLSGDHIVEQHVHNLDVVRWAMNNARPVSCVGLGGRQVRTG
ncbi:MAG: Gfo/Idh/MocA family oxidoreductase, partial [Pyrinomonadaceae bacterium]|nr:Gfo/Idh/MocA family oxidoreductase [Phycisphaerales bacterium]